MTAELDRILFEERLEAAIAELKELRPLKDLASKMIWHYRRHMKSPNRVPTPGFIDALGAIERHIRNVRKISCRNSTATTARHASRSKTPARSSSAKTARASR